MKRQQSLQQTITKPTFILIVTALFVLCMDLLSKAYIQTTGIPIVKNFGAGFGILDGRRILLLFVTTVALLFLVVGFTSLLSSLRRRLQETTDTEQIHSLQHFPLLFALGFGSIIGGALGNLYDRVLLGYVRDFIHTSFWPSFNIADSFISIGTIAVIILFIVSDRAINTNNNNR